MRASTTYLLTILAIGPMMSNSKPPPTPSQLQWPSDWHDTWRFQILGDTKDAVGTLWGPKGLSSSEPYCTIVMPPALTVADGESVADVIHFTMTPDNLEFQTTSFGAASYTGHTVALHNEHLRELLVVYMDRGGTHRYPTTKIGRWKLDHKISVWRIGSTASSAYGGNSFEEPVLYRVPALG